VRRPWDLWTFFNSILTPTIIRGDFRAFNMLQFLHKFTSAALT
jgi:hypothetical protein